MTCYVAVEDKHGGYKKLYYFIYIRCSHIVNEESVKYENECRTTVIL